MSLFFIINNIHLAVSLIGALAFFMMGWLSFDAFSIRRNIPTLAKAIGLILLAIAQVIDAFTGFSLLPAGMFFNLVVCVVSLGAGLWYYREFKAEQNPTLIPLWSGFLILFLAKLLMVVFVVIEGSNNWVLAAAALELVSFGFLFWWVWQYLVLRVREEMMLIFAGMALLVATVVTVAFSSILVTQVSNSALANLTTSAKVMDLAITNRQAEALAKVRLLAGEEGLSTLISDRQVGELDLLLGQRLQAENLDFLIITDEVGEVVKSVPSSGQAGDNLRQTVFGSKALLGESVVTISGVGSEPLAIVAGAPIIVKDSVVGVLVGGFYLDDGFVDKLKKITGLGASIYSDVDRIATTEIEIDGTTRLSIKETNQQVIRQVLNENTGVSLHTTINSKPYLASYLPLHDADGKTIGMVSASQSGHDVAALATKTNQLTFIIIIILMIILMVPIYFVAKRLAE